MGKVQTSLRKHARRIRKKFTERGRWEFDVYLLSYPKCGRTWVTLMVGRAITQHFGLEVPNLLKISRLGELHPEVPLIRETHDGQPHRKRPHELPTTREQFAGKKVILLVRDPRDVLVSYYHHKSKREPLREFFFFQRKRRETHSRFAGTLAEFLDVEIGGFDTLLRYYNLWAENRHVPKAFLLLRYEDLQADPHGELRRVLDFLGLAQIPDAVVKEAVEYASFANMQKIESGEKSQSYKLKPGDPNDLNSYKVRRGKVGGYADELSPAQIETLDRKMASVFTDYFGYQPNVAAGQGPSR